MYVSLTNSQVSNLLTAEYMMISSRCHLTFVPLSPLLKMSMDHPFQVSIFKKDQLKLEQAEGKLFPLLPYLKEVRHLFTFFLLAL